MPNIEMIIHSISVALIDYRRAVILKEKNGDRYLPLWIGSTEADAIVIGLPKACTSVLLTHDFVCSIIKELGAILKYVILNTLTDDNYQAKTIGKRE